LNNIFIQRPDPLVKAAFFNLKPASAAKDTKGQSRSPALYVLLELQSLTIFLTFLCACICLCLLIYEQVYFISA
jgi:hypothetical protein